MQSFCRYLSVAVVVAVLGCVGLGLGASLLIIPAMALMQGQVPAEMRGRVSSSAMSMISISQGIALLFAGNLALRFGIVAVFYGSAVLLLLISIVGAIRLSALTAGGWPSARAAPGPAGIPADCSAPGAGRLSALWTTGPPSRRTAGRSPPAVGIPSSRSNSGGLHLSAPQRLHHRRSPTIRARSVS